MRIGLYSGSFDPVTNGHIEVIKRATKLVDKLVIGVINNKNKDSMFSLEQRVSMILDSLDESKIDKACIEVEAFTGMLVDFAKMKNASINIRGVRNSIDYEYEKNMSCINKELYDELETVLLFSDKEMSFISSSMIKEIASYGKDVSKYVPDCVSHALKATYNEI